MVPAYVHALWASVFAVPSPVHFSSWKQGARERNKPPIATHDNSR